MKRTFLLLSFMLLFCSIFAQIPREEAFEIIKNTVLGSDTTKVSVYVSKRMLPVNAKIATMNDSILSPNFSSWMFFIDDDPFQNWAHPVRFIFIGNSGQVVIQKYNFPPPFDDMDILIRKIIIIPPEYIIQKKLSSSIQSPFINTSISQHKYAVIISGGYNKDNNYERYWNDCAAIYSTLVNVYSYDKSHIYVLISDGTNPATDRLRLDGTYDSSPLDLDGDGIADIQYSATKANITSVFNSLSNILTSEDDLFIYTIDHGGSNSGQNVFMYLWGETIQDYEFAAEVNKIKARTINIVMGQCNSGGFIDNLSANNRVIATACTANESSGAMPPYYDYDEFVYHWTSAVAGYTPSGAKVDADTNKDGFVSMDEAFTYANTHDTRPETPQYASQPTSVGQVLSLWGYPAISGPTSICPGSTVTFTVSNAPANYTWGCSSNLFPISGSQGKFNVSSTPGTGWVSINYGDASITYNFSIYTQSSISGPLGLIGAGTTRYYATSNCGPVSYSWRLVRYGEDLSPVEVYFSPVNSYVDVTATSAPGQTKSYILEMWSENTIVAYQGITVQNATLKLGTGSSGPGDIVLNIYPNPASDILNVEINEEVANAQSTTTQTAVQSAGAEPSYNLRLYDAHGNLKQHKKTSARKAQLNVSHLHSGIYYLHIYDGANEKQEMQQIIVKH